ncbi:MAG: GNAT family N-acetyltransferase [Planctomycetaceae bacterium]
MNSATPPMQSKTGAKPDVQARLTVTSQTLDETSFTRFSTEFQTWQTLFEQDPHARITQHPELLLTELRHLAKSQSRRMVFIQCCSDSETLALAILIPKSVGGNRKFWPAWRLNGYRLLGNRFLGNPTEHDQNQILAEVTNVLKCSRADFLLIEDIENSDPLLSLLAGNPHGLRLFRPAVEQRRWKIELPGSLEDYYKKFSSRSRNSLRRKVKRFGECRLERIDRPDQVAVFLEESSKISLNSWQHDLLGERISTDEIHQEFFTTLAIEGGLRAYQLWKVDRAVSFVIATQYNGVLVFEETAYDRQFTKESPGQVLLIKMLEDLFAHNPPRVFDFGGGDAEYKRMFGNVESVSGNIWILRPGLRSRLIVSCLSGRRTFNRCLRSILAKTGLLEWIRRKSRRGI